MERGIVGRRIALCCVGACLYPFMPSPRALPKKWPSSMISSAARSFPKVCCVMAGMLYEDPACKSSACTT